MKNMVGLNRSVLSNKTQTIKINLKESMAFKEKAAFGRNNKPFKMEKSSLFHHHIIKPFLSALKLFPNHNAFYLNEEFYSYEQLGQSISAIRLALRDLDKDNLEKDNIYIGLIANNDIETYASVFAIWLEGKAYVPLMPNQPVDRSAEIIKQMNISTLLDSGKTSKALNCDVINTSALPLKPGYLACDINMVDDSDAYVLFTSGSTGMPKGVRINRKNLGSFMDSFWNSGIKITEDDKCLQCFDLTFDVSVQSFLAPLLKGACVFTVPHDQIKYSYVYGLLEERQITFGAMAPSMLLYLKPYFDEINITSMKYCILTGEASPLDLVEQWAECIPNARIYDFYGPTETTIYCTYNQFKRKGKNKSLNGMLSVGRPMKNVEAIIVDENYHILADGKKGELCISGDHVSAGYWDLPEKNRQAFFEKNINGTKHRFYRTGDLCYYDDERSIMLIGRLDAQVKIQGYRVELGEIEFHARQFANCKNVVVLTAVNATGFVELILFVEAEENDSAQIIDYLKTKLPFYMIPSKVIIQKELPLNSNGKTDRKKLKESLENI